MNRALVKKIDVAFSKYVRARDTKDGWGRCCSCGAMKLYAEGDCGHFINRRHMSTRWHDKNSHFQCASCNRFQEGNAAGYSLFMIDKYGREMVEYLMSLSRETARFTDIEGELLLKDFRQRLKLLTK